MDDEKFLEYCFRGSSKQIINAIKNGANVNAKDEDGVTALMWTVINSNNTLKAVKALIEAGADVNAQEYQFGSTALIFSVDRKDSRFTEVLLEAGADVNAEDVFGNTALYDAAQWCKNEKTMELLLDAGIDVYYAYTQDNQGKTALDYARENKNLKGSKVLERLEELTKLGGIIYEE